MPGGFFVFSPTAWCNILCVDNIYRESVWISPYRRVRHVPRLERVIIAIAIRYR
jgi:hypothetical protein